MILLLLGGTLCSAQDKVEQFAHAIARTEGYYVHGSLPSRCFNPGDLKVMSRGGKYPGQTGVCKAGHVRFEMTQQDTPHCTMRLKRFLAGESDGLHSRDDVAADGQVLCTELTSLGEEPSA